MAGGRVELISLTKRFAEVAAVDSVDLTIASGEFFSLAMVRPIESTAISVNRLVSEISSTRPPAISATCPPDGLRYAAGPGGSRRACSGCPAT